jgi:hypothetical protein
MPSAAPSFLLLRFLCRHKENDVAVGQPRRFCLYPWIAKFNKKSNSLTISCSQAIKKNSKRLDFQYTKNQTPHASQSEVYQQSALTLSWAAF